MTKLYRDRIEAGQILASLLKDYAQKSQTYLLALPRGGVPVAYEMAQALSLPLEVLIVRKLGLPGQEEYAMGALTAGRILLNKGLVERLQLSADAIEAVILREKKEWQRRENMYRGAKPYPSFQGKTLIVVDDGMATGYTMRLAVEVLQSYQPAELLVAVPVAASCTCEELSLLGVRVVCPLKPTLLKSVGTWYENFNQTSDEEVVALLKKDKARS